MVSVPTVVSAGLRKRQQKKITGNLYLLVRMLVVVMAKVNAEENLGELMFSVL